MKLRILTPKLQEPFAIRIANGSGAARPKPFPTLSIVIHKCAEPDEFGNVKRFSAQVALELDGKKLETIKDEDGNVTDFQNIRLKGYLSTFGNTDRQGDVVEPGAFRDTLKEFMQNPVLLTDHRNSVANVAGHFTTMKEDKSGLAFEAMLSNAPELVSLRFKIVEGSIKATSMGGIFTYAENGRTITRVQLWEGSIVALPANGRALFEVRALDDSDKKYLRTAHQWASYHDFLKANP